MLSLGTSSPVNLTGEVHVSQRRPGYRYGVGLIAPPNPLKKIKVTFPCNATRSRNHWDCCRPSGFCFYKLVDNFLRLGFIRCFWLGLWFRSWCGPWCYLRCWFGCGFYFRRCASVFVFLVPCKGSN